MLNEESYLEAWAPDLLPVQLAFVVVTMPYLQQHFLACVDVRRLLTGLVAVVVVAELDSSVEHLEWVVQVASCPFGRSVEYFGAFVVVAADFLC